MHKLTRWSGLLLLVVAVSLPAFADKAKSLYNQGKDAEARQDYVQAYEDYRQAYNLKPNDLYYRTAFERLRFLAAATKVHQGQLLRQSAGAGGGEGSAASRAARSTGEDAAGGGRTG